MAHKMSTSSRNNAAARKKGTGVVARTAPPQRLPLLPIDGKALKETMAELQYATRQLHSIAGSVIAGKRTVDRQTVEDVIAWTAKVNSFATDVEWGFIALDAGRDATERTVAKTKLVFDRAQREMDAGRRPKFDLDAFLATVPEGTGSPPVSARTDSVASVAAAADASLVGEMIANGFTRAEVATDDEAEEAVEVEDTRAAADAAWDAAKAQTNAAIAANAAATIVRVQTGPRPATAPAAVPIPATIPTKNDNDKGLYAFVIRALKVEVLEWSTKEPDWRDPTSLAPPRPKWNTPCKWVVVKIGMTAKEGFSKRLGDEFGEMAKKWRYCQKEDRIDTIQGRDVLALIKGKEAVGLEDDYRNLLTRNIGTAKLDPKDVATNATLDQLVDAYNETETIERVRRGGHLTSQVGWSKWLADDLKKTTIGASELGIMPESAAKALRDLWVVGTPMFPMPSTGDFARLAVGNFRAPTKIRLDWADDTVQRAESLGPLTLLIK